MVDSTFQTNMLKLKMSLKIFITEIKNLIMFEFCRMWKTQSYFLTGKAIFYDKITIVANIT